MTDDELQKQFAEEFECDCYDGACLRDCRTCSIYQECFEEYKQTLGYCPSIMVGLDDDNI